MTEMAIIYTAGEVDPQALALLLKERDELRAALKARDEEIGLLNGTLESRNRNIEALHEVSAEQRKPLTRAQKNRIWSSCSDATTLSARASLFGTKIEQYHNIIRRN